MVFVTNSTFFSYVFVWRNESQKETCFDILDRKEWFLDLKSEVLQKWKKSKICKGVSPWFLSKNRPFSHRFLSSKESQKESCLEKETCFDILDTKECCLDLKSEVLKKWKKWKFFKGVSPWFFSKNRPFSHRFFFSKERKKDTFFDILDKKEWFLDLKSEVLKSGKNLNFDKLLVHGFCQKIDLFLIGFFWAKKERKTHFLIFWIKKNDF